MRTPKLPHRDAETHRRLRPLLAEILRFAGSGAVLLPTGLAVSAFLHEIVGLEQRLATAGAVGVMLILGFVLGRSFIFRSQGRIGRELPRFAVVSLTMRGAEYLVFLLLFGTLHIYYLLAMTIAVGISFTFKFVLYRTLVFAHRGDPGAA